MPHPEPHHSVFVLHGKCSVVRTDPQGSEPSKPLEVQGRMLRISPQQAIGLVGEASYVLWKLAAGNSRTWDSRGASPLRATSRSQILKSFVRQRVQPPRSDVVFDPAVPRLSVEFHKPRPKCGKFGRGEPQNSILDLVYATHQLQSTLQGCARTTVLLPPGCS